MSPLKTIVAIFCILNLSTYVLAAECGRIPTDGCVVNQSTSFANGEYNFANGIEIYGDDLILDCNNSKLMGPGHLGIDIFNSHNVTVKNCMVWNYSDGIWIDYVTNLTISNVDINFNEIGIGVYFVDQGEIIDSRINDNLYVGIDIYSPVDDIEGLVIRRNAIMYNEAGVRVGSVKKKKAKKKSAKTFSGSNVDISENTISYNVLGLEIRAQFDEVTVNQNNICHNDIDIKTNNISHGDDNTCDVTVDWNDDGTTGCSYSCCQDQVPEFTFLGSFLALAGLGVFLAHKRKKAMVRRKRH